MPWIAEEGSVARFESESPAIAVSRLFWAVVATLVTYPYVAESVEAEPEPRPVSLKLFPERFWVRPAEYSTAPAPPPEIALSTYSLVAAELEALEVAGRRTYDYVTSDKVPEPGFA